MEPLIELIYTGSATFERERLKEFLLVAKDLHIKDLCSFDEENYIGNIYSETAEKDTSLGEDNFDILQRETPLNVERADEPHPMTDQNIEKYIPNSDENVKIEEDEENGFQPNQLNNMVVNSAENTPIEESCEQIEHISEKSSEEDKNANPDVKDMQLLVQAIKSEHLPKSSGEIRKKKKVEKNQENYNNVEGQSIH